jgi:predicted  nucleic acid-binding Zn-ribbon protein
MSTVKSGRQGMATRQGAIHRLKGKLKSQKKALKEAKAEHHRSNDSVSAKAVEDMERKIRKSKDDIMSFRGGFRSRVSGLRHVASDTAYEFKSGGIANKKGKGFKGHF